LIAANGWGKPAQTYTAEDGEGEITVILRYLVESRDARARPT
jgi:hypothetical protein